MKRMVYVCIVLCFLMSGCSLRTLREVNMNNSYIDHYDDNTIYLRRDISWKSNTYLMLVLEDYRNEKKADIYLYQNGEIVAVNEKENCFYGNVKLDMRKKDGVLTVIEHVYYYDKNDLIHNFSYDKKTDIVLHHYEYAIVPEKSFSENMDWNLYENIVAFTSAFKIGIYSLRVLRNLHSFVVFPILTVLFLLMIKDKMKYSILCEKTTKIDVFLNGIGILSGVISLIVSKENLQILFRTCMLCIFVIRYIRMLKLKHDFINNPPEVYEGHIWMKRRRGE